MSAAEGESVGRPAPEPGWYADPQGTGTRWWDGQGWTAHTQAAPTTVATVEPTFAPGHPAATWTPSYGTVPTFPAPQADVGNTPAMAVPRKKTMAAFRPKNGGRCHWLRASQRAGRRRKRGSTRRPSAISPRNDASRPNTPTINGRKTRPPRSN